MPANFTAPCEAGGGAPPPGERYDEHQVDRHHTLAGGDVVAPRA